MNIPDQLRYTSHHLWVEFLSDGSARAGITDHAQETLGDIVFVESPTVGSHIESGKSCGVIESVKTASDLHAPLSGQVLEINSELQRSPEQINEAPYAAWIFRMRPDNNSDQNQLLDASGYRQALD
jgi:glycine cleavage system H protein